MKIDIWKLATALLVVAVVIMGVIIVRSNISTDLTANVAVDKAIRFINEKLSAQNETATLVSTNNQKLGMYQFIIDVSGEKYAQYVSADGKILFPDIVNITESAEFGQKAGVEVCKENDKPIIYFFGSKNCPHCEWEKPILEDVISKFGDKVSFHENIDSQKEMDIFSKYSNGPIPTIIIGCKYYRVGSGEAVGETQERSILTKNICAVTGNLPAEICNQ